MNWYLFRFAYGKVICDFQFSQDIIKKIPIPKVSSIKQKEIVETLDKIISLDKKLSNLKSVSEEGKINNLFYKILLAIFLFRRKIKMFYIEKTRNELKKKQDSLYLYENKLDSLIYDIFHLNTKEKELIDNEMLQG